MNRRKFVQAAALAPLAAGNLRSAFASGFSSSAESGKAAVSMAEQDWPGTPIHDRYELTLRRVLEGRSPEYTEEFVLDDVRPAAGRRFTEYSGDISGRYIGALSTASRVYGTHFPGLDALVAKVIALQKPDGYFGSGFHYEKPTDLDMALLWGNGRLLVGLIEYYRLVPSPAVLAACVRLGNFLVRVGPLMLSNEIRDGFGAQHFASSYICWTQQVEGLANLYQVTRDERYRVLAEAIIAVTERRAGDHAHGYLTSVRGWVDLYNAFPDSVLLRRCEAAWQDVVQSQDLLITGGVPEGWSPNNHRTEGCGETDWVRLSLALWKATDNAPYLQMAERTIFNELAFNQYEMGDFGHRVYTETGLPAAGAVRAWWCCTLHGLRCFPDIQNNVFRAQEGGLTFDLPMDGRIEKPGLSAKAESFLAHDATVRITILSAGKAPASLSIRRPEWANELSVKINNVAIQQSAEDGYVRLRREWRAGDLVALRYGMEVRQEDAGKNRTAYFFGPWLLGAPASENPAYFNELTPENRLAGMEAGSPGNPPPPALIPAFVVPIAQTPFHYIPAEYPEQPGRVVLRAIAEQTGQPTTSWELRFLTQSRS
ncbi:glycoside hydrolase family 127 protein [Acidicapsa acidisoli]|uniref:glycoside hydrolase family 127 protein n=1 Tax=Acidicapsa acidisoli TaxID=1615681 RepID=UPI0021E0D003|nr:glycoside hydrolase family 127 protein [Acidicapsa acidisoli]